MKSRRQSTRLHGHKVTADTCTRMFDVYNLFVMFKILILIPKKGTLQGQIQDFGKGRGGGGGPGNC